MRNEFSETQAVGVDELVGQAIADTEADSADSVVSEVGNDEEDYALLSGDSWNEIGAGAPASRAPRAGKKVETLSNAFTVAAATTTAFTMTPLRDMSLGYLIAQQSNPDHRFLRLIDINCNGKNELNGGAGFPLDMAFDVENALQLSGVKVKANQPINLTISNTDAVNARTAVLVVKGPSA